MTTKDAVLLLHGLGRSRLSMVLSSHSLRAAGFDVLNVGYPSRRDDIDGLARFVAHRLSVSSAGQARHGRVHVLTHSMGGIVFRRLQALHPVDRLGRVVMLSPPNHGSRLARRLVRYPPYRWLLGPAVTDLGTEWSRLEPRLGSVDYELGVITGNRPRFQLFAALLSEPNDGKVEIREAQLSGMRDLLVVPSGHSFIMNHRDVIRQAVHFFRNGAFDRRQPASS